LRRRGIAAVLTISLVGPVLAEGALPIAGAFGNEAGCAFYMSGDRSPPDLAVITPYTFTAHDSGCQFETLISEGDGRFEIQSSCSGGALAGDRLVTVTGNHIEGYAVAIEDKSWDGLSLCPGTEVLFGPRGIQI
jgi:hypothetical protein